MAKKLKKAEAQLMASELGIDLQKENGKDKTIAELTVEIQEVSALVDSGEDQAEEGPGEEQVKKSPDTSKGESVSAKAGPKSPDTAARPGAPRALPFEGGDVIEVEAGGKKVTICLSPLRDPRRLNAVYKYLNRGTDKEKAAAAIADCILKA